MDDQKPANGPSSSYIPAIGGTGGSGTRVLAEALKVLGYTLGQDLNDANDNLWFTLLFKRLSVLVDSDYTFSALAGAFQTRMEGRTVNDAEVRRLVVSLACADRLEHSKPWLESRVKSFLAESDVSERPAPWGWKEPNTHVIIERLLRLEPRLRYMHVVRHPIDMALSLNQNQLKNWGAVFLDRQAGSDPRSSLAYWCAVHKRIDALHQAHRDRIFVVRFESICRQPDVELLNIARWLGCDAANEAVVRFSSFIKIPLSIGRGRCVDLKQFEQADLEYAGSLGFDIGGWSAHS